MWEHPQFLCPCGDFMQKQHLSNCAMSQEINSFILFFCEHFSPIYAAGGRNVCKDKSRLCRCILKWVPACKELRRDVCPKRTERECWEQRRKWNVLHLINVCQSVQRVKWQCQLQNVQLSWRQLTFLHTVHLSLPGFFYGWAVNTKYIPPHLSGQRFKAAVLRAPQHPLFLYLKVLKNLHELKKKPNKQIKTHNFSDQLHLNITRHILVATCKHLPPLATILSDTLAQDVF